MPVTLSVKLSAAESSVRKMISPQVKAKLTSWSTHAPPLVKDGAIVWNASVVPVGRSFDSPAAVPSVLSKIGRFLLESLDGLGPGVRTTDVGLSKLVSGFFSWSSDWLELGVSAMVDLCVSSYDYIHAACPFYTHTAFSWVAGW